MDGNEGEGGRDGMVREGYSRVFFSLILVP